MIIHVINLSELINSAFPLKSSEILRFSDDFRGNVELINFLKFAEY